MKIIRFLLIHGALLGIANNVFAKEKIGTVQIWSNLIVVNLDDAFYHSVGGFPPENRNAYASLLRQIAKTNAKIVFLDLAFTRKSLPSEQEFVNALQHTPNAISLIMTTDDPVQLNFRETQDFQGSIIRSSPISQNPFKYMQISKGIEIPEIELTRLHRALCVSVGSTVGTQPAREIAPYEYFNGRIYENSPLTILNIYLQNHNLAINLSADFLRLELTEANKNSKLKILAERKSIEKILVLPMHYSKMRQYSALDVVTGKAKLKEGAVILIGATATGVGDKWPTPSGYMPGIHIIANQVNTLWNLIKNDIPAEKP
jgi:hypothetical protein